MAKMGQAFEGRTIHYDWHNQRPEAFGYTFKSKQEYRWAQYLNILSKSNNIWYWRYELKTFYAKKIRWKKLRQYTPDFFVKDYITLKHEWHEVKTSLRQKDITRFRWFKTDYPDERLILVLNSCPKKNIKQIRLLDNAQKYVDDVIFAGPILRKLGI